METTIKSIFINDKNKDGQPYINKNGEPFKMASLISDKGGKATMYLGEKDQQALVTISTWKPGDTVNVLITESNGFHNFALLPNKPITAPNGNPPNLTTDGSMKLHNLEVLVKSLELRVSRLEGSSEMTEVPQDTRQTAQPGDPDYIDVDKIPF